MQDLGRFLWLTGGIVLGVAAAVLFLGNSKPLLASNDRFEDFVMCTGPVGVNAKGQTDGVWLLDYRSGKLLGTVIDRGVGKITGWAEVDLVSEFGVQPKQPVHFLMTTGNIAKVKRLCMLPRRQLGNSACTRWGLPRPARPALSSRRHDLVLFRQPPPEK